MYKEKIPQNLILLYANVTISQYFLVAKYTQKKPKQRKREIKILVEIKSFVSNDLHDTNFQAAEKWEEGSGGNIHDDSEKGISVN